MRKMVKPKRLSFGGTIGVIAPAGVVQPEKLEEGIGWLIEKGFRIKRGRYLTCQSGYLAGTDVERAKDVMDMFLDDQVDAIICARGGYGCMRLLPMLKYNEIRKRPKIFVGYSDITALHVALQQQAGMISFHGPMVASSLCGEPETFSWKSLCEMVDGTGEAHFTGTFLRGGHAEGILVGGNLSVITSLMGTPYELSLRGAVLCIEEVNEAAYRIDRMLTQLLLGGKLKHAAGIVIGDLEGCDFKLPEVLMERFAELRIPILTGIHFGHGKQNITLPFGVRARIDSNVGGLVCLETSVV